jgi:hypothetical protein
MWHGLVQRLHAGTSAILNSRVGAKELEDEPVDVEKFEQGRWVVRLSRAERRGKVVRVEEPALSFGFSILPRNIATRSAFAQMVAEQDACGRGLIAIAPITRGAVLYEEQPMFVSPTGTSGMWAMRWRSYLAMAASAEGNPMMALAMRAFDELTEGHDSDEGKRRLWTAAEGIFDEAARSARGVSIDASVRQQQVERVFSVLMRWQSNQFKFDNGAGPAGGASAAIYRYTAAMNHSCSPTVMLQPQWAPLRPGTFEPTDGTVVAKALQDVAPGQPLTINYGPKDLPTWPVERRRDYMRAKHGFVCGCRKCESEAAYAEKRAADNLCG